jgi:hypothetical protein
VLPSGARRKFALNVSISVFGPALIPASFSMGDIFAPRSKPLNRVFRALTGPLIVNADTGPEIVRFAAAVPPSRAAPEGITISSAGSRSTSPEIGAPGAERIIFRTGDWPG